MALSVLRRRSLHRILAPGGGRVGFVSGCLTAECWYSFIIIFTGFDWNRLSTLMLLVWACLYALAISPAFYDKVFK